MRSPGDTSQAYDVEDMVRRHQEIEDDFSPPFPKLRESLRSRQSDREAEHEKPHRARRNVPRPDYAEMVANKDPWNASEAEIEVSQRKSREKQANTGVRKHLRLLIQVDLGSAG